MCRKDKKKKKEIYFKAYSTWLAPFFSPHLTIISCKIFFGPFKLSWPVANLITAVRIYNIILSWGCHMFLPLPLPSPYTSRWLSYHYDMLKITNDRRAWLAKQTWRPLASPPGPLYASKLWGQHSARGGRRAATPPSSTDCAHWTW